MSTPAAPADGAGTFRLRALIASPLVLALLLGLGVAGRGRHYLRCPSYWYDEAYVLLNVFDRSWAELAGPLADEQAAPPLFLWALRGLYRAGGSAEWLMRLPAFACTLAALLLMIPLARRLVGRPGWVVAVGLCAVCHQGMLHGCEVKPYAGDLLVAEAVLLAAAGLLLQSDPARPRLSRAALLGLAVVGPWASFPSVFVLGGAALALLLEAVRRRDRSLAGAGLGLALVLAVSAAALWFFVVRHQHSPYLEEWWAGYFPDVSSPSAALRGAGAFLVEVAHYCATGLAVPLLLLGALGCVVLARRCPGLAVLLAAPLALTWLGGALHRYPPADRLVFFAAPCVWLPAAAGVGAVAGRLRGRAALLAPALLLGLVIPGAVRMAKYLVVPPFATDFREAFAFVRRYREPGDALWVSHPQVYEVYFGRSPDLLGCYTPPEDVEAVARKGRLWVVCTPQCEGLTCFPEVFARLGRCAVPVGLHHVPGVEVALYLPLPAARPAP